MHALSTLVSLQCGHMHAFGSALEWAGKGRSHILLQLGPSADAPPATSLLVRVGDQPLGPVAMKKKTLVAI